jgi:protein-disulfide isomerase
VSTARQIDQTYVKTGQVKIVSKNFAVHGEQAAKMSEAALCARSGQVLGVPR